MMGNNFIGYERDVKILQSENDINLSFGIILLQENIVREMLGRKNIQDTVRKSKKVQRATGNHTYLTITLRVMLVGDF